jgi:excisionase family DNA binding protein
MNATPDEVTQIMGQQLATVEEAAKVLRVGRSHAYAKVRSGELRSIHIGRRVLIPTDAIRELTAKRTDAA